jgi:hypothetical protein
VVVNTAVGVDAFAQYSRHLLRAAVTAERRAGRSCPFGSNKDAGDFDGSYTATPGSFK